MTEKKILYRNESYVGSEITDAERVIEYEMFELGNNDIPDTIAARYATPIQKEEIERTLNEYRDAERCGDGVAGWDKEKFAQRLLQIVKQSSGRTIRHVLWLTSRRAVNIYYEGGRDGARVKAYTTSEVILSDLGEEGCLFGYESKPIEIKAPYDIYQFDYPQTSARP